MCVCVCVCCGVYVCVCCGVQGYRSVGELSASGLLNRQQIIGVKHYEDFQERMPREEVSEIEERVSHPHIHIPTHTHTYTLLYIH